MAEEKVSRKHIALELDKVLERNLRRFPTHQYPELWEQTAKALEHMQREIMWQLRPKVARSRETLEERK